MFERFTDRARRVVVLAQEEDDSPRDTIRELAVFVTSWSHINQFSSDQLNFAIITECQQIFSCHEFCINHPSTPASLLTAVRFHCTRGSGSQTGPQRLDSRAPST